MTDIYVCKSTLDVFFTTVGWLCWRSRDYHEHSTETRLQRKIHTNR